MDPRIVRKTFDGARSGDRYTVVFANDVRGLETLAYLWMLHQRAVINFDDPFIVEKIARQKNFYTEKHRVQGFIFLRALPSRAIGDSEWHLSALVSHLASGLAAAIKGGSLRVSLVAERKDLESAIIEKNVDLALYAGAGQIDFLARSHWDEALRLIIYNGSVKPSTCISYELCMDIALKVKLIFVD